MSVLNELNFIIIYNINILIFGAYVTCSSPGLSKVDRGGEDAFLVSNYNGGVIAVADGVSGYDTDILTIWLLSMESKINMIFD